MSKLKSRLLIALAVITTLAIAAIVIVINNISAISDPYMNEQYIDKRTFKGEWPFTLDEGVIRCDKAGHDQAISFNSPDGITYALNDSAQMYAAKNDLGWQAISTQNISKLDAQIDDVMQLGLELCTD